MHTYKCTIHMHESMHGAGVEKVRGFCPTLKRKSLKHILVLPDFLSRNGEVLFEIFKDDFVVFFFFFYENSFMCSSSGLWLCDWFRRFIILSVCVCIWFNLATTQVREGERKGAARRRMCQDNWETFTTPRTRSFLTHTHTYLPLLLCT